jgi:hypothetical protein
MPSFEVFGVAAIVFVLLWMRGEDYRKRMEVAEARIVEAEDHADRAVRLLDDVLAFTGDLVRKIQL